MAAVPVVLLLMHTAQEAVAPVTSVMAVLQRPTAYWLPAAAAARAHHIATQRMAVMVAVLWALTVNCVTAVPIVPVTMPRVVRNLPEV